MGSVCSTESDKFLRLVPCPRCCKIDNTIVFTYYQGKEQKIVQFKCENCSANLDREFIWEVRYKVV